jgi:spermidine synthase
VKPWRTIDQTETDEGLMTLQVRDDGQYVIAMPDYYLMHSRLNRTELALGSSACRMLETDDAPEVLIGGLGMAFTLRAALDELPAGARVTVAELNPTVVRWCRDEIAHLTDRAVDDPRVHLHIGDVAALIRSAAEGRQKYDAVVLDLYQGTHDANRRPDHPFYGRPALERTRAALRPRGVLAVWTEHPDRRFEERVAKAGFEVQRTRPGKGGPRHAVYLARRIESRRRRRPQPRRPRRR